MNPRRLQSATISSSLVSSAMGRSVKGLLYGRPYVVPGPTAHYPLASSADLRIPLPQRTRLRGDPEHVPRPIGDLRGLRCARRAGLPPGGGALQGIRLLLDRLRQEGQGGRRQGGRLIRRRRLGGRRVRRLRGLERGEVLLQRRRREGRFEF